MKFPFSWLKDFIDLKIAPEKLAELLTLSGSEVEKIHQPQRLEGVVVGEIVAIEKHPNADKLQVVVVRVDKEAPTLRSEQTTLRVVCGAFNIKAGDKVPVALPGAVLANGVKLERREVRGVASDGMLCAEDELGLGSDHVGILILPKDAPLGVLVSQVLGLDDTVFDLDITPNRGDCLSIRGLAREVAALTGQRMRNRELGMRGVKARSPDSTRDDKGRYQLSVHIEDKKACPLYFGRLIEGITIGPSPLWMQQRLASVGLRPINIAVDVANYVMMELGQPLHMFDAHAIGSIGGLRLPAEALAQAGIADCGLRQKAGQVIELVVRRAKKGEKLLALDGKTYALEGDDLVIARGHTPLALAGVIGGEESGTTEATHAVVLEAAVFDPVTVRRTWKAHGLRTESAVRFEKRIDAAATVEALDRATALLLEYAGGDVVDTVRVGAVPSRVRTIPVSPEAISRVIGVDVPALRQKRALTALGFTVRNSKFAIRNSKFLVAVPTWRHDIDSPHDLVEEVGRLIPYNQLKPTQLVGDIAAPAKSVSLLSERAARQAFLDAGFDEVLLYSFYGALTIERMGLKLVDHVRVANPLSASQEYLRLSLLPNLIEAAAKNAALGSEPRIFEIGAVFLKEERIKNKEERDGVRESMHVAVVARATPENLRAMKAALATLGCTSAVPRVMDRSEAARWKLRLPLVVIEVPLPTVKHAVPRKEFAPLPSFPAVLRDLSIAVPSAVTFADVMQCLQVAGPVTVAVELTDVYEGRPLPSGMKSFTFHLEYSAVDRTLTAEEVDALHARLIAGLEQKIGAKLRAS